MNSRFTVQLCALAGVLLLAAGAGAAPVARPASMPTEGAAIAVPLVKVHGCHFDLGPGMEPDRYHGPHYHDRTCAVVRVGPRRGYQDSPPHPQPPRRYRDPGYAPPPVYRGPPPGYGYGPPPRGPICQERCRYTGPIKRCRVVCQ